MTESQKIIFEMAIEKLISAIPRASIISGGGFGFHKSDIPETANKYKNWAVESDTMGKELKEALRLLKIIQKESNP